MGSFLQQCAMCDELEDISLRRTLELLFLFLETAAREEALTPERLKDLRESFMADLAKNLRNFHPDERPLILAA